MDFLLRRARIVELDAGPGWVGPVDLLVEAGRIRDIDHDLPRPPGFPEVDADGRWVIPGLWDQHTHLAMWTATLRPARPGRHPFGRRGTGAAAGPARGVPGKARRRLRPPPGHLAGPADGRGARRGRARRPGGARQRRRPPRLAELARPRPARRRPARRHPGRAASGTTSYARHPRDRRRRDLARGLRPDGAGRRRARASSGSSSSSTARRSTPGPTGWRRGSTCFAYAAASTPTGSTRWSAAGLRTGDPLRRGPDPPGPVDDGTAEDHQRRFAQHAYGVVRAPVRRRVGPRRRQPVARGAARADDPGDRARAAHRRARHRRRGLPRRGGGVRGDGRPRLDRARPADDPRTTSPRWRGSASSRACSPPTCSTTATSPS